jgi:CheY-like chemotaxis protein
MFEPELPATRADAIDWSHCGLGPIERWHSLLRLTVDIVLNTPLPMLLCWGDDRIAVCNEAYARLAAGAGAAPLAPGALATPPWLAAAALEQARAGAPLRQSGQRISVAEGAWQLDCDLHFTPLRDERGQLRGVLCALAACVPVAAGKAAVMAPCDRLRILVVEDNLDAQYLVCEMLNAFGHHADGVAHAEGALELLADGRYQVLFSDLSLPGMSGLDLARQALAGQPALKVIFASGYGDTLLRHVAIPHLSLQKPYDIDQLQQALATIEQQLACQPLSAQPCE